MNEASSTTVHEDWTTVEGRTGKVRMNRTREDFVDGWTTDILADDDTGLTLGQGTTNRLLSVIAVELARQNDLLAELYELQK